MRASWILTLGFVLTISGCGSDVEVAPDEYGGSNGASTDVGPLEAPVIEEVIPMSKVLRVRWSVASTCDAIEGERRTDAVTYAPIFTVSGTDTDYVDDDAYENQTYTYRVRCIRGDKASEYSNQMGANPFIF
ncbi:MAG TPA: hypothetical protein PK156_31010 [Polyangium sp.]|nr:hypothetical protein [Polyangium sp.]